MGFLKDWRDERRYSKAAERAAKVGSDDLYWWMDSTMSSISRKVRSQEPEVMEEAVGEAETLYCLVAELHRRRC